MYSRISGGTLINTCGSRIQGSSPCAQKVSAAGCWNRRRANTALTNRPQAKGRKELSYCSKVCSQEWRSNLCMQKQNQFPAAPRRFLSALPIIDGLALVINPISAHPRVKSVVCVCAFLANTIWEAWKTNPMVSGLTQNARPMSKLHNALAAPAAVLENNGGSLPKSRRLFSTSLPAWNIICWRWVGDFAKVVLFKVLTLVGPIKFSAWLAASDLNGNNKIIMLTQRRQEVNSGPEKFGTFCGYVKIQN